MDFRFNYLLVVFNQILIVMKRSDFVYALLTISVFYSCSRGDQTSVESPRETEEVPNTETLVKRGAYLVTIMNCNYCHSPHVSGPDGPVPDPDRLLSGHPGNLALPKVDTSLIKDWVLISGQNTAMVGPWGVSYAGNITSDVTGIGRWTEEQFSRAIREGKFKGLEQGRTLLLPMPWRNYASLNDEDVRAIYTYLKTTKPIRNVPPGPRTLDQIN